MAPLWMSILLLFVPLAFERAPLIEIPPPPMPSAVAVMLRIERRVDLDHVGLEDAPVLMVRFVSSVRARLGLDVADVDRAAGRAASPTPRPRGRRPPDAASVAAPPTPEKRPLSLPADALPTSTIRLAVPLPAEVRLMPSWAKRWPLNDRLAVKLARLPPSSGLKPLVFVIDDEMPIGVPPSVWRLELVGAEAGRVDEVGGAVGEARDRRVAGPGERVPVLGVRLGLGARVERDGLPAGRSAHRSPCRRRRRRGAAQSLPAAPPTASQYDVCSWIR